MEAPLVMTSGNRSDEPIAYGDEDALARLGDITDYFLVHDRPIHMRCDDSVARLTAGAPYAMRRSRGYAPAPLALAEPLRRQVLACGGELKNTFCLARDRHAFLSHHIGDLENYETLRSFQEGIAHYCRLFDIQPQLVAYDLHPEYLSTTYAHDLAERGLPAIGVQHHHAHIAGCLADNECPVEEQAIGVALDGTGYGSDGAIWGGEVLVGSIRAGFRRRAHLEYLPLPGGEAAIRHPWRMAVAQLIALYGEEATIALPLALVQRAEARQVRQIARLLEHRLNTPVTSSAGRLFDVVAALVCLPGTQRATYEGQAAVELELAAGAGSRRSYPFRFRLEGDCSIVETRDIIAAVVEDLLAGTTAGEIAAAFHQTMAAVVGATCARLREESGVHAVALSGGTFQNMLLLQQVIAGLSADGFVVYRHRRVPTNDGGLSLGQAVLADQLFRQHGGSL
jgi:hydrogenase maturation protein HypF